MLIARGTALVSVQGRPLARSKAECLSTSDIHCAQDIRMSRDVRAAARGNAGRVLLFDVMDTIVKDPFYQHMPVHFNMTFQELLAAKHPTTWIDFEKGNLTEEEALTHFFSDGRSVDGQSLKGMLIDRYEFLPGMPELLKQLQGQGIEMHVISNYPEWYRLVEDKLQLSQYLPWTFISCTGPMKGLRKPDRAAYDAVCQHLDIAPEQAIIIDDRKANIDAALEHGMHGIHMSTTDSLRIELRSLDVDV